MSQLIQEKMRLRTDSSQIHVSQAFVSSVKLESVCVSPAIHGSASLASEASQIAQIRSILYRLYGAIPSMSSRWVAPHILHSITLRRSVSVSPEVSLSLRLHVPRTRRSPLHMEQGRCSRLVTIKSFPLRSRVNCDILIMTQSQGEAVVFGPGVLDPRPEQGRTASFFRLFAASEGTLSPQAPLGFIARTFSHGLSSFTPALFITRTACPCH